MTTMVLLENLDYKDLTLNSCREYVWKNRGINWGWNAGMVDTIMVDSTVMRTDMSSFLNPCYDLASISKFSILT
jgi:hypothetical protein